MLVTQGGWGGLQRELASLQRQWSSKLNEHALALAADRDDPTIQQLQDEITCIERRILELQAALDQAVPVESADRDPGTVAVGSRVTICWEDSHEETYVIVGPPEADLLAGRISYESPVGHALMGKRQGELLEVVTPSGQRRLVVVEVE